MADGFGQVRSGMEVVTAISKAQTSDDKPITPIVMLSIKISGLRKEQRQRLRMDKSGSDRTG